MDPVLIILLSVDALLLLCCIVTLIYRAKSAKKTDFLTAEEKNEQTENTNAAVETVSEEKNESKEDVSEDKIAENSVTEDSAVQKTQSEEESAEENLTTEKAVEETKAETALQAEQKQENSVLNASDNEVAAAAVTAIAAEEKAVKKAPKIEGAKKGADPFYIKMLCVDEETQGYYNEIRNEFKSYKGVNARISKGYDSFRKNKQLIARILLSGKTIRLYLRLNAGNYENSKFHKQYVGDKKTYAEIPMLVKIKSKRGLANAKLLVQDLMKQENAVKKTRFTKVDYIETLKALKEND